LDPCSRSGWIHLPRSSGIPVEDVVEASFVRNQVGEEVWWADTGNY